MAEAWLGRRAVERRRWYFENLDRLVEMIRSVLDRFFTSYEIYLFGSVAEGDYTMASDIDILVVTDEAPRRVSERSRIVMEVYKAIGLDAPVELHLVDREGFEWYRRFARKLVKLHPRRV